MQNLQPDSGGEGRPDPDPEPGRAPSDRSLLRRFMGGSQGAANLLYQRYAYRLLALARSRQGRELAGRLDDDDIVQSVFKSFFRGAMRGSYDVPAGEELWSLFLVMTLNKIRSKGVHHRSSKRDVRQTVGGEEIEQCADAAGSDGEAFLLLKMSVEEALERLPEQKRRVVGLRMEGYEIAEIGAITGRSKRSVERILQECRERLSRAIGV